MRGAERAAVELASELNGLGIDNCLLSVAPAFDGNSNPRISFLTKRARIDPVAILVATWRMRRRIRREPADVVLAHGGTAAAVAALSRHRDGPAIVWQRILPFPAGIRRPWSRVLWRWVARRTDAAIVLTPDLVDELRHLGFTGPTWEIGNFRDPDRFAGVNRAAAREDLRSELGLTRDAPLLGLVGHLIEQKRPERSVEVLRLLERSSYDAHLVIAGDGPLRDEIERYARELGVEARTHLLGHRADIEQVLAGLDLLVLTSDSEGIPGILIEAQMSGCPVITYPVGAVAEVVDDGETGVILARADTEAMAAAVAALLDDPERARRLGEAARRRADRFSIHHVAADYVRALESVAQPIGHGADARPPTPSPDP